MDIIEWNRSWWKRKGQKVLLQESPILLLTSAGDTSFSMATLASTLLYRAILFQQSGYQSFRRVAVAAESPSTPGTLNTKIEWKWGGGEERPYVAPRLISQALFRETFLQLILLLSKVILAWKYEFSSSAFTFPFVTVAEVVWLRKKRTVGLSVGSPDGICQHWQFLHNGHCFYLNGSHLIE